MSDTATSTLPALILEPTLPDSSYKGSPRTYQAVYAQIKERLGEETAKAYRPEQNARTFRGWLKIGYCVKKNEKGFKSFALVEEKNTKGEVIKKHYKPVYVFLWTQVSPLSEKGENASSPDSV